MRELDLRETWQLVKNFESSNEFVKLKEECKPLHVEMKFVHVSTGEVIRIDFYEGEDQQMCEVIPEIKFV